MDRNLWICAAVAAALCACAETPSVGASAGSASSHMPAPVCADLGFPIYFELGSDQLTSEARQVIADNAARIRGCRLGTVDVVGLADARNTVRRAMVLSERRAVVVADTMKAAGLPAPNFQLEAKGKEGARPQRGIRELLRHRVDVTIHAGPATVQPVSGA